MRAAILHGKEDLRIEEVSPKPLEAGEVRIQIEAALTCGTDLKVFRRGYHAKMITPPSPFGHELAGIISEIRKPREEGRPFHWQAGDRVVVANSAPCGTCFYCRKNQENLCEDLMFLNGAYAESIPVPSRLVEKNLLKLKPTTEFKDAALVEPLACVVQGIQDTGLQSDERVLILGAGPIGLMFVALASHLGCKVSVIGKGENRLKAARTQGAESVINVGQSTNFLANLPPPGFDVVIEAVGKPETWETAVRCVRKGGRVNFFGGCASGTTVSLDTGLIHYSSLTLMASFHHSPRTIRRALEFIEAGVVRAADFVDGECPLGELPKLFQSMAAGNHAVKSLILVRD